MKKEKTSENLKNFNKLISDEVSPALKDFVLQEKECKDCSQPLEICTCIEDTIKIEYR